jgi:hypothetical protein
MKRCVALLVLAGCPSDGNPSTLFLAPKDNELHVQLIDHEPPPF